MNNLIITAAAGLAALGTAAAIAGEKKDKAGWEAKVEAMFIQMDANADGALTEAEYVEFKAAEARAKFAEMAGENKELTLAAVKDLYATQAAEKSAKVENEGAEADVQKDGE